MTDTRPPVLSVDPAIFAAFPTYVLAVVWCSGPAPRLDDVEATLSAAEQGLLARFASAADLMETPRQEAWRTAYRTLGVSHSKYPNAASSLARRVLKQGALPRLNPVVDLCNAASLESSLPVAACTLDRLDEPVLEVRRSTDRETFTALGADAAVSPDPGEVIYADPHGNAHSRRWNWRQSDALRTDADSRDLVVTVESLVPGDDVAVGSVAASIAEQLRGAADTTRLTVLSAAAPRTSWDR